MKPAPGQNDIYNLDFQIYTTKNSHGLHSYDVILPLMVVISPGTLTLVTQHIF